jgi:ribose 1,5-bisphosphokinase PhnN
MKLVPRVVSALQHGVPVAVEFGHKRKAAAIESVWQERHLLFKTLPVVDSIDEGFRWCSLIPFIRGPALRHQAVRDLGLADVAKPDRLMERIAARGGESVQVLCERLARATGDSCGTVDVVLWYAASKGIIEGISCAGANRLATLFS